MKTIIEIKIRGYHIDQFNHVNNARYLEFLEEGRWDYSEKNDLIVRFHKKGISHVTANINISYRKSAYVNQILRVETDLLAKGEKSIFMRQNLFLKNTDTLIADAVITNVYLDQKTGKVLPINEAFIQLWPGLSEIENKKPLKHQRIDH